MSFLPVTSFDPNDSSKLGTRMTLTTVKLRTINQPVYYHTDKCAAQTYKMPVLNMAITPIFFLGFRPRE